MDNQQNPITLFPQSMADGFNAFLAQGSIGFQSILNAGAQQAQIFNQGVQQAQANFQNTVNTVVGGVGETLAKPLIAAQQIAPQTQGGSVPNAQPFSFLPPLPSMPQQQNGQPLPPPFPFPPLHQGGYSDAKLVEQNQQAMDVSQQYVEPQGKTISNYKPPSSGQAERIEALTISGYDASPEEGGAMTAEKETTIFF